MGACHAARMSEGPGGSLAGRFTSCLFPLRNPWFPFPARTAVAAAWQRPMHTPEALGWL